MPNITVSAQIPFKHWKVIDEAVRNGEYKNMSEFIRKAIEIVLEEEK